MVQRESVRCPVEREDAFAARPGALHVGDGAATERQFGDSEHKSGFGGGVVPATARSIAAKPVQGKMPFHRDGPHLLPLVPSQVAEGFALRRTLQTRRNE